MVVTLTLCLAGCDEAEAPTGGFQVNLPADKAVGALSTGEGEVLCAAYRDHVKLQFEEDPDLREGLCATYGIYLASIEANAGNYDGPDFVDAYAGTCQQIFDSCQSAVAAPKNLLDIFARCEQPPSTCTATVGDVSQCVDDLNASARRARNIVPSCQSAAANPPDDPRAFVDAPSFCAGLSLLCPDWRFGVSG